MSTSFSPTINGTIVRNIKWGTIAFAASRLAMRAASVLAPRFAVKQALDQFLTPPRFQRPAAERRLLVTGRKFYVHTTYGRIAAWRFGNLSGVDGPIVLMSHGWGGRGSQFRGFIPPLIAAGYQIVVFDHIGHGDSEGHYSSLVAFWRGLVAVQQQLLHEGSTVFGMVSHSLGGAAVCSALRSAAVAKRAVMIAPPSSLISYSNVFARYLGITERIRHAMQWRVEQRYGVAWDTFELPHSVNKITTPALIIHDHDDRIVRIDSGLAVARAWPDARFHETRGLGHQQILRNAEVIQNVVDFLGGQVEFLRPPVAGTNPVYDQPAPLY